MKRSEILEALSNQEDLVVEDQIDIVEWNEETESFDSVNVNCIKYKNVPGYFFKISSGSEYWIEDPNGMDWSEIQEESIWIKG